jgi:hypothetical protein
MARRNKLLVPSTANPELGFSDALDIRKRTYLLDVAQSGGVMHACQAAQISRVTVKNWRDKDPNFSELEQSAYQMFAERLEKEALRRAVEGIEKGVWYKGSKVGNEREYSDSLLATLLKANMPEKYGDALRVGGNGTPIKVMTLGMSLDSEETHAIIDKLLLSSYRSESTKAGDDHAGGQPGGNGSGGIG